jgi:hypothetical protein
MRVIPVTAIIIQWPKGKVAVAINRVIPDMSHKARNDTKFISVALPTEFVLGICKFHVFVFIVGTGGSLMGEALCGFETR